jgi:hypothetical protein
MKYYLLPLVAVLVLALGPPASAQYMWLDTNGDGVCNSNDTLSPGNNFVDVYLATDRNAGGSVAVCPSGESLTINSYTFVLSNVTGGEIAYGQWTDAMGFSIAAGGPTSNSTDYFIGRAGANILPPGTYKLGTLAITLSGAVPVLDIMKHSTIDATSQTSFGSQCEGQDFNNTMRYGENSDGIPPGDWNDVCGTSTFYSVSETTWGKIKQQYSSR